MICLNIPLKSHYSRILNVGGVGIIWKIEKILERCQILTTPSFLTANYKIYASLVYAC